MEAKGEGAAEAIVVRSSGRPTVTPSKPTDPAHINVLAAIAEGMSINAACKKHKVPYSTFCKYVDAAVWWGDPCILWVEQPGAHLFLTRRVCDGAFLRRYQVSGSSCSGRPLGWK